jgi:glycosyltransferase involved in cell wall biosynthesis
MVTLANGFAALGLRVDLVLAVAEGPYLAEVAAAVRVVDLRARGVVVSLPGLTGYLRRERPDAMLSAMNHANVIVLLARRLAGVRTRVVVSERAHLSLSLANEPSRRARLLPWFMRRTYRWADGVVAVSAGVADDLAQATGLSRASISVIHNPVVTEQMLSLAQAPLDHPWFAPEEPPVILAVGRLAPEKKFDVLLQAFARLRRERRARLLILGEGERRSELEALAGALGVADDVALPGFEPNPYAYMRRAGLFVLSSRFEGLPNALIQAMTCGVPVVSTDCPSGPAEILENGRWGRLVPVGDVEALAAAMLATITEMQHPDVAGRAADFGADRAVDEYLRVLRGTSVDGANAQTGR